MSLEKRLDIPLAVIKASLVDNERFSKYTIFILLGITGGLVLHNILFIFTQQARTLTCLSNETQNYFRSPQSFYAKFKEHVLYAPLFGKRHSEPIRIGRLELVVIPTRWQGGIFFGIVIMNITFATYGMEWSGDYQILLMHFRNRLGTLALTNMLPLFFLSGRNSPLIALTRIPFDTFNLIHRWFGHLVIVFVIAHASVEFRKFHIMAGQMHKSDLAVLNNFLQTERFLLFGFIAFLSVLVIFFTTFTAFRRAFYETFLNIHIVLAALILAALWNHLDGYPPQILVKILIAIWVIERCLRLATLVYRNIGHTITQATIETLPGDTMRINLKVARPWRFRPGQHVFLTIPSLFWMNHPFTVAWSDTIGRPSDPEKDIKVTDIDSTFDALAMRPNTVSLVVRRRSGFTEHLYRKLLAQPRGGPLTLPALVEGPYGGDKCLDSYGTIMLVAGGIGITHQIPYIRHLVSGYSSNTVAARKILLVWVIRSAEHLEWIRPWMTSILAMSKRREVLRIQLFVTQPKSCREVHSPSTTVQMFPGRPDLETLVEMERRGQLGAMAVGVCGPGSLGDDVRAAVRRRQERRNIDLVEASFGW
ncbi:uncharacterized protein KY384_001034 [Bacidia gigantensis]|uniref:uncharacterized protein n=1 Tax=Bacidia gigantensis TaxID=2732470 RepID=UPI001D0591D4|nr:uncharacterized protein KY384_001034 [Bacidia gigantensis]KAG8534190.1 hypothetical protein KY384_001034 [Bacidia gigantensis]